MNYPKKIKIGDKVFDVVYEIVVQRSSSVRVKNGKVVLRLSRFAFGRTRDEMVERFLKWAGERLARAKGNVLVEPVFDDGGQVVTHNKVYEIKVVVDSKRKNARSILNGNVIEMTFPVSGGNVKWFAEKVMIEDQTSYLEEVVDELNQLYFQEQYGMVRFKRALSRFGSCSSKRNLNIALRLLYAPREVFRYVCVHELAHLKEMNHSRSFWALVAEACPNYKQYEKWLRESGFMLG